MLERLNASNPALTRTSVESDTLDLTKEPEMVPESVSNPVSITEELDHVVKEGQSLMQPVRYETLLSKIQKEMTLFENGGTCGDHLQRAYSFLMTVKPKSIEAELAFSSAGLFSTKIHNHLDNQTLDALCIMKSHFKPHKTMYFLIPNIIFFMFSFQRCKLLSFNKHIFVKNVFFFNSS